MRSFKVRFGIAMLAISFVTGSTHAMDVVNTVDAASASTPVSSAAPSVEATPVETKELPVAPSAPSVVPVPVKVIYVRENQPVQIIDSHGRLLQVIYLRKSKN